MTWWNFTLKCFKFKKYSVLVENIELGQHMVAASCIPTRSFVIVLLL